MAAPIFGVTGNTLDMDVRRFTDAGANEVFGKPFDLARFKSCMAAHAVLLCGLEQGLGLVWGWGRDDGMMLLGLGCRLAAIQLHGGACRLGV